MGRSGCKCHLPGHPRRNVHRSPPRVRPSDTSYVGDAGGPPLVQGATEERVFLDINGDGDATEEDDEGSETYGHYETIRPPGTAIHAARDLIRLVGTIPARPDDSIIMDVVNQHKWSKFNMSIFWAGDSDDVPFVTWLEHMITLWDGSRASTG